MQACTDVFNKGLDIIKTMKLSWKKISCAAIVTVILLWVYLDPKVKAGTQQGLPAIDPQKNNWVYSIIYILFSHVKKNTYIQ